MKKLTAPVGQQADGQKFRIWFTMPSLYTRGTLPVSKNPEVKIRELPARCVAAIGDSGGWSEERYREKLESLRMWVAKMGPTLEG